MIDYYKNNMNILFPGSGYLGCYYIGVLGLLEQIWPHHPYSKLSGASSGGLIALAAAAGISMPNLATLFYRLLNVGQKLSWPPISRCVCDVIRELAEKYMPIDAHKRASGKVLLSLTNWNNFANIRVTHFDTRSDLIDAFVAAGWIPLVTGTIRAPKYLGIPCIDGGLTDNVPQLELNKSEIDNGTRQVTVYTFSGQVDVCPDAKDNFGTMWIKVFGIRYCMTRDNILRGFYTLLPSKFDKLRAITEQGYKDMKRFIIENDYLKCRECYKTLLEDNNNKPQNNSSKLGEHLHNSSTRICLRCLLLIEKVSNLKIPQAMIEDPGLE